MVPAFNLRLSNMYRCCKPIKKIHIHAIVPARQHQQKKDQSSQVEMCQIMERKVLRRKKDTIVNKYIHLEDDVDKQYSIIIL